MNGGKSAALLDALPTVVGHGDPPWLAAARRQALARLTEQGFPTKKVEGWRFTSVRSVVDTAFAVPEETSVADDLRWAAEQTADDDTWRIPLLSGRIPSREDVERSGSESCWKQLATFPEGVSLMPLREFVSAEPEQAERTLGTLAPREYFGALNSVLFQDGWVIRARAGVRVPQTIQVVHVGSPGGSPSAAYPRLLVVAEPRSELRLVETYLVPRPLKAERSGQRQLTNAVTEVFIEAGATVEHARVQHGSADAYHVAHLAVRQARASTYRSQVAAFGGALGRLEIDVTLAEEGADCTLLGVYHVDGEDHLDHQTRIVHAAPRCSSREVYRGVLGDRGRAVFNGIIVVDRDAPGSVAHQENRNLLLSDNATINTKPHLEIDNDNVQCSHGATVGALDEDQLFYLRARGIEEALARDLLAFAFVESLLREVLHQPTQARLRSLFLDRLPQGTALRGMLG